jgi:hypothetical protein
LWSGVVLSLTTVPLMRIFCIYLFSLFFFTLVCLQSILGDQQNEILEMEKKCLSNRLVIKTYHVKVKQNSFEKGDTSQQKVIALEFYYGEKDKRLDTTYEWYNLKIQPEPGYYTSVYTVSGSDKKYYHWFSGISEDGLPSTLQIYPIKDEMDAKQKLSNFRDLLILGFSSSGLALHSSIDAFACSPERKNIRMTDDILNGIPCKKISFEHIRSHAKADYWIVPEMGYSVIRLACKTNDGISEEETNLQLKKEESSGIWFPSFSKWERFVNKELTDSEELQIEVVSFNKKLDHSYFTPSTMNVPAGTVAIISPLSAYQNYFWDGEKVVDESGTELVDSWDMTNNTFSLRFRLFILACGFVLIGIALLLKYFSRRNRK